jgi:hypothetical protein
MVDASRSCLPTSFLRTYMSLISESNRQRNKFPRPAGGGAAYSLQVASNQHGERLDPARPCVEDRVQRPMKLLQKFAGCLCLTASVLAAHQAAAQNPAPPASDTQAPPVKTDVQSRITIEVVGGEKDAPVENASVYVKYVEEHKLKKDKKLELNVKTNREGVAHVPNAPLGRVLIQVVAEGWHSYGRWYDITDVKQTLKVHLERPAKWY